MTAAAILHGAAARLARIRAFAVRYDGRPFEAVSKEGLILVTCSPDGTRWALRLLGGGELKGAALRDTFLEACLVAFVDYQADPADVSILSSTGARP